MRIALVVQYFDPSSGGAGQWTVAFAQYLLEKGHAVLVVTFDQANHSLPVESYVLPFSPFPLERARRVAKCVRALRSDVVYDGGVGWSGNVFHPHTGSNVISDKILLARYSTLRRLRTRMSPRGWFYRWSVARLESEQARRADLIVALSRRVYDWFAEKLRVPAKRIMLIPNGVDARRFDLAHLAQLREPARRTLGAGDATLFLLVAQNMLLKGADNAIRALGTLVREGAPVRLAIVGGTPDTFWTALAAKFGVNNCVNFVGRVVDMAPLYAAADAVVHPTRWDACSLATLEGFAAGLPVITTAMNGAADLICHGKNGLVFDDPEDNVSLAAQMRILLDPQQRRRIGAAARETAMRHNAHDNFRAIEKMLFEVNNREQQA